MPTRRQLIQKITLNANASSVTFSNIPQNYTDLKIVASTRSSFASTAISIKLRFNGSASDTNHSCRRLYGSGSSAASDTQAFSLLGVMGGSTSTSNTFSIHEAYIPNYTGSNNKTIQSKSTTEENATTAYILQIANLFSSTSPITSIEVLDASGSFVANSTFYLYGITQVPIIRGGEVSIAGGFKYHTFRSSGSLQVIEPGDVEYLIVAGGGGGGGNNNGGPTGGGGGAGGMISGRSRISSGVSSITIGAGGSGRAYQSPALQGGNGSESSFLTLSTTGGGGGGRADASSAYNGSSGGSGGGGGTIGPAGAAGGSGTSGQGSSGGNGVASANAYGAGGGGGKSSSGSNGSGTSGGAGGSGLAWLDTIVYAGGGGGGRSDSGVVSSGGAGGGGAGGASTGIHGGNGLFNTGGGGGGAGGAVSNSGNGGSGIVIIRYPYDGN